MLITCKERLTDRPIGASRGDGVDGPLRHQCARMRLLQISDKGAVRGSDYPNWVPAFAGTTASKIPPLPRY